jgi:hypothetical protein
MKTLSVNQCMSIYAGSTNQKPEKQAVQESNYIHIVIPNFTANSKLKEKIKT